MPSQTRKKTEHRVRNLRHSHEREPPTSRKTLHKDGVGGGIFKINPEPLTTTTKHGELTFYEKTLHLLAPERKLFPAPFHPWNQCEVCLNSSCFPRSTLLGNTPPSSPVTPPYASLHAGSQFPPGAQGMPAAKPTLAEAALCGGSRIVLSALAAV